MTQNIHNFQEKNKIRFKDFSTIQLLLIEFIDKYNAQFKITI